MQFFTNAVLRTVSAPPIADAHDEELSL